MDRRLFKVTERLTNVSNRAKDGEGLEYEAAVSSAPSVELKTVDFVLIALLPSALTCERDDTRDLGMFTGIDTFSRIDRCERVESRWFEFLRHEYTNERIVRRTRRIRVRLYRKEKPPA